MTSTSAPHVRDLGCLSKAVAEDGSAVIATVEMSKIVDEVARRVKAFPPATKHMGEALIASALLRALGDTSEDEKVELQWKCVGSFGSLYADALPAGGFRASIQTPQPEVFDFEQNLGPGLMQVRRMRAGTPAYTGIVKSDGDVKDDVLGYLLQSEQKTCLLETHVHIEWDKEAEAAGNELPFKVVRADGVLIHILPQSQKGLLEQYVKLWEQRKSVCGPLATWGIPADSKQAVKFMTQLLTVGSKPSFVQEESLSFQCTCSAERAENALKLMDEADGKSAEKNSEKQSEKKSKKKPEKKPEKQTEIRCEFCGTTYRA